MRDGTENWPFQTQENMHINTEEDYMARINKDLGEVFVTNCSRASPIENTPRHKFFTNKDEQEHLEDEFEKEFNHRHPSYEHSIFGSAEQYDMER